MYTHIHQRVPLNESVYCMYTVNVILVCVARKVTSN